jgi:hypothetical protein
MMSTDHIQHDIAEWESKYTLLRNKNDEEGYWETYGEDYEAVKQMCEQNPKCVWTIIDNNDGWYGVVAGWHWINRQKYAITIEEWQDENEEYTIYDTGPLREQWESLNDAAITEVAGKEPVYSNDEEREDLLVDWFYIWEEIGEEERDRILAKYK